MGFALPNWKTIRTFDLKELHKRIGRILIIDDGDSDLQEKGYAARQIWFHDVDKNAMYLVGEIPLESEDDPE